MIASFQVAESMGFKGDLPQWEHLMRIAGLRPMQKSAATLIFKPAAKLLNVTPLNDRGSPFCFEPGSINQGRATSRFFA